MTATEGSDNRAYLATALASPRHKRIALVIAAFALLLFLAIVPFVRRPLLPMPAFIPSYEAALFFIDLITSVLLFDQALRLRSISVVVLAAGYLFDAFILVPHAMSFPGAFASNGLLGGGPQTTAWLYVFWHGGFPLFVMAYAVLRRREATLPGVAPANGATVAAIVIGVAVLVALLVVLVTWQHDRLPVVMQGRDYSLLVTKGISPAVWALTLIAMLALWQKKQRVVDLWLMLVMWIWLFDIGLSAVIGSSRFDLGFYAGRIFGLIAASFLLVTLIVEMAQMFAGAMYAAVRAEQQLAVLGRVQEGRPRDRRRGDDTASYIQRENIARYQALLQSSDLDVGQRRAIEKLLAEEEAKSRAAGEG
jgi:hypothetical protein